MCNHHTLPVVVGLKCLDNEPEKRHGDLVGTYQSVLNVLVTLQREDGLVLPDDAYDW